MFFWRAILCSAFSIPWLGGEGAGVATNLFLWPDFVAEWPINVMPDPSGFNIYTEFMPAWGVPAINTVILLASGATVTFAHWELEEGNRSGLCWWLAVTVALGFVFVCMQAYEYVHAHEELSLTMHSGIYGTTFYMLTGFHGVHVSLGATMLAVILARAMKGHFREVHHFAFEAFAWYWHFVDVVWLMLFITVYWV